KPGIGCSCSLKALEGRPRGVADIKTPLCATHVAVPIPAHVALELIDRVEPLALDEAFRETEGHRRIIGPLPHGQIEGPAADHVRDGGKGSRRRKLQGRPQGIADCEAKKAAAITLT